MMKLYFWKPNQNQILMNRMLTYQILNRNQILKTIQKILKASKEVEQTMEYYKSQIKKYWLKRSLYAKGLMSLTMHRMNDDSTAAKILRLIAVMVSRTFSLFEHSHYLSSFTVHSPELCALLHLPTKLS